MEFESTSLKESGKPPRKERTEVKFRRTPFQRLGDHRLPRIRRQASAKASVVDRTLDRHERRVVEPPCTNGPTNSFIRFQKVTPAADTVPKACDRDVTISRPGSNAIGFNRLALARKPSLLKAIHQTFGEGLPRTAGNDLNSM